MAEIILNKVKDYLLQKEESQTSLKKKERESIILDLKSLATLWEKYNLNRVYLYGSFCDLTFAKHSDIDLAIEPEIDFEDQLRLYSDINRYIKRPVDVRLLKELPFSDKIQREGIILYERENSHT